ncbi:hypothetical protein EV360DRAFT_90082 [Lentinula raphanica]|nr:hypothetical protein EV360DRAFT_90082 [Lentinula raphanica]
MPTLLLSFPRLLRLLATSFVLVTLIHIAAGDNARDEANAELAAKIKAHDELEVNGAFYLWQAMHESRKEKQYDGLWLAFAQQSSPPGSEPYIRAVRLHEKMLSELASQGVCLRETDQKPAAAGNTPAGPQMERYCAQDNSNLFRHAGRWIEIGRVDGQHRGKEFDKLVEESLIQALNENHATNLGFLEGVVRQLMDRGAMKSSEEEEKRAFRYLSLRPRFRTASGELVRPMFKSKAAGRR